MRKTFRQAIVLTIGSLLLLSGLYPLLIWGVVQVTPQRGHGQIVLSNGKVVGYHLLAQAHTSERYFWPRPSATSYNAAGSAGSNKGPTNQEYLNIVKTRCDSFLVHHPYLKINDVPSEMVTASGSGLDPHVSPYAALVQVRRIAVARNLSEQTLKTLVQEHTQGPLLGLFGPSVVNVLELNVALDSLAASKNNE